ncbi:MAG: hypothetical protein RL434_2835 [Pseudomonadota bacterium]|jgi:Lon protease-like protein
MSGAPSRIALFPLHTVLFPGGTLPLQIFEPRYLELVRDCTRSGESFGVVPIQEGREAGGPATPYPVGTAASIIDWSQGHNGLLNILVRGGERFDLESTQQGAQGLLYGEIRWRPGVTRLAPDSEFTELRALLQNMLEHAGATSDHDALSSLSNAEVVWRIAEHLPLPVADKMGLLTARDDLALLEGITTHLAGILRRTHLN